MTNILLLTIEERERERKTKINRINLIVHEEEVRLMSHKDSKVVQPEHNQTRSVKT